jgi:C4-dicarboxylate transporter DctQ subunit
VIEINEYILLYITFLVAAWVLKSEGHIKMDMLLNRLSSRTQSLINAVTSVISAIVCCILAYYGAKVSWDLFRSDYFTPTILEVPKCIIIAVIFLGSFLLFLQFLKNAYGHLES